MTSSRSLGIGRAGVGLGPQRHALTGGGVDDDDGGVVVERGAEVGPRRQVGRVEVGHVGEQRCVGAESVVDVPRRWVDAHTAALAGRRIDRHGDPVTAGRRRILDQVGVARERQEALAGVERVAARPTPPPIAASMRGDVAASAGVAGGSVVVVSGGSVLGRVGLGGSVVGASVAAVAVSPGAASVAVSVSSLPLHAAATNTARHRRADQRPAGHARVDVSLSLPLESPCGDRTRRGSRPTVSPER